MPNLTCDVQTPIKKVCNFGNHIIPTSDLLMIVWRLSLAVCYNDFITEYRNETIDSNDVTTAQNIFAIVKTRAYVRAGLNIRRGTQHSNQDTTVK